MLSRGPGAGLRERERGEWGEGERVREILRGVLDGDDEGALGVRGKEFNGTRVMFEMLSGTPETSGVLDDAGKMEVAGNGEGFLTFGAEPLGVSGGVVPLRGELEEDLSRDMEDDMDLARSRKNFDVDDITPPPLEFPLDSDADG